MKKVKSKLTSNIGRLDFDSKEGTLSVAYYDLYTKELIINYYKSLEDLCEEWEDYEEPKKYYYINDIGAVQREDVGMDVIDETARKEIGNYFGTEEETEKAVKKLEAWKRLKDLGFKCSYHSKGYHRETFTADFVFDEDKLPIMDTFVVKDLNLLFGGEE